MGFTQDVAIGRALPRLVDREGRSGSVALPTTVGVLRGRQAVAARHKLLVELSHRTGQAGTMEALELLLDQPSSRVKIPYLVLVGRRDTMDWDTVTANDLDGAVLIYEYRIAGRGTGVFATDDDSGERTVIASVQIRTDVAEMACQTLLEQGASTVVITLAGKTEARVAGSRAGLTRAIRMGTRTREVPRYLPLGNTLDETLAMMGKHTRRNLRYYRRRLEAEVDAVFVPSVAMGRDEFLEFNRMSLNPFPEAMAMWRYEVIQRTPDSMVAGVKARDGRWLSLIGGRRYLQTAEISWQMNLAGLPRYSLSTVMRSYLLEHEVGLGTKKLTFIGGTPHSMRHSFANTDAVDVIVQRRSLNAWLLRRLSRWIFPKKNFLSQTLRDKEVRWTNC